MSLLRDCFSGFRFIFASEAACRICYFATPLFWIFGSFYIALNSISIYTGNPSVQTRIYVAIFGIFLILCGIFTAANTIHVCLQLPTSFTALKLQKTGQGIMIGAYTVFLIVNIIAQSSVSDTKFNGDFQSFLIQASIVYALLGISTVSCFYSS
ncbi:unnamed protein product [Blepharisma stoltei]|uniref:MARVEL domain-containing protein n=1 Tax=Blepharisma stoltei TaxID=1481888 RepID=A0AAU9JPL1_9CILI|nr:unnamed protein product [Blepharisma stoltei]